jgi:hypothetical protein
LVAVDAAQVQTPLVSPVIVIGEPVPVATMFPGSQVTV